MLKRESMLNTNLFFSVNGACSIYGYFDFNVQTVLPELPERKNREMSWFVYI